METAFRAVGALDSLVDVIWLAEAGLQLWFCQAQSCCVMQWNDLCLPLHLVRVSPFSCLNPYLGHAALFHGRLHSAQCRLMKNDKINATIIM
jgi:hypothetical protein